MADNRDYIQETVDAFFAGRDDLDPTDPVKAIAAYFERTATPELKERCAAEKKTPETCWKFIEEVARKVLGSKSGHLDPSAVYAAAMHYFQDVPADWDKKPALEKKPDAPKPEPKPAEPKPAKAKPKKKSRRGEQAFFFDVIEEGGDK